MDLNNKVIVVTGGARGLGFATAEMLSKKGAKIAIVDINQDTIDEAILKLPNAKGYKTDISQEDQVETLFEQVIKDFGRLDGLVNNAGILQDGLLIKLNEGKLTKMTLSQWQSVIDVNLTGVFLCGREAAAHMAKLGNGGAIINMSSISRAGNFGQTNYSAAKAAIIAMTVTWAKELARYNIRTGAVAPGFIKTEMTAQMPAAALAAAAAAVPLKRVGTPAEIAASVTFIFENDYFNGRVIETDGGARI